MNDFTPSRPEGEFNSDPLYNLLDEESDEDFGYVVTRDRATGPDGHPVKLADWSAQDFASIYTRFRPHLERHARRFLNNPSQVDEVVQDAFLYLMVSLPELDSEIGVLRFLKWKTRLLCLDVIRASGKAYVANIDDVSEPMSSGPEVSSYLEQQDDAAVLRLALSKLNPRHREVLLASIYEEKSTEQIAAQVGLSENATRQLIFRARAAFKKALLGDDVNTNGMSAAAILSVAARKAAMEVKKVGAQAMVFVLFMMLAIGAVVNFTGRGTQVQQVAESGSETYEPSPSEEAAAPLASPSAAANAGESEATGKIVQISQKGQTKSAPAGNQPSSSPSPTVMASPELIQYAAKAATIVEPQSSVIQENVYLAADKRQLVTVQGSPISARFEFAIDSASLSSLIISFEFEGKTYRTYPYAYSVIKSTGGSIALSGQLGYFVDSKSRIVTDNPLQSALFQLILQTDGSGRVSLADLKLVK